MKENSQSIFENYFAEISSDFPKYDCDLIVLTHICPDRPEFLSAINSFAQIVKVIAIPYSVDIATLKIIKKTYQVLQPSLNELLDRKYLKTLISNIVKDNGEMI